MMAENQPNARKVALVLTGGGAKGAFQWAAEEYARQVKGYQWDVIAGVSVGALNASMLAMEKYDALEQLWTSDLAGKIHTGDLKWWSILSFGLKQVPGLLVIRSLPFANFDTRSILGNEPLRELIDREFEVSRVRHDLRIGTVSLQTGLYYMFRLADGQFQQRTEGSDDDEYRPVRLDEKQFRQIILASTAIPAFWPPENIRSLPYLRAAVDGGVRNINPVGDVLDALDADNDEVVIVSCSPGGLSEAREVPTSGVAIAERSLDIVLTETAYADITMFRRINDLVEQAARGGVTLRNKQGQPYRHFKWHLIEPEAALDDTLDFSPAALGRSLEQGRAKAKEVLG